MADSRTRAPGSVVVTGIGVTSAFGRGTEPLLAAALSGRPAFGQARRFSVERRRAKAAAELAGAPVLAGAGGGRAKSRRGGRFRRRLRGAECAAYGKR